MPPVAAVALSAEGDAAKHSFYGFGKGKNGRLMPSTNHLALLGCMQEEEETGWSGVGNHAIALMHVLRAILWV